MRLTIPHAPRAVRLSQIPGALRRLGFFAAGWLVVAAAVGAGALWAVGWFSEEQAFLDRAVEVDGVLAEVKVQPDEETAKLTVLYRYGGLQHSASGIVTSAEYAQGIGRGAPVRLLLDPSAPERPREAGYARARAPFLWLVPAAVIVVTGVGLGLFLRELGRTVRHELAPLRVGALVWLTPEGPLPGTRREIVFEGTYLRGDTRHKVRARGRPGRAPVRNGEKVLAAVLPSEPAHARVVDEDLARALGWLR